MKNNSDNAQMPKSCLASVSSSVISDGWIEVTYDNLPNETCRVYICIDGIPQKRSREFWINGSKRIKCGKNTGRITHFKVKL